MNSGYDAVLLIEERDVISIHTKSVAGKHRGTGVRHPAKLTQLVRELHEAAEQNRPLVDILARVFDDIERDPQPFTDCNHRTAMQLGRFIARQFGYKLKYSGPEGKKLRKNWEKMSRRELKEWILVHLVPFEGG